MKDEKIFIDTNILIYLVKDTSGKAEVIASKISENSKAHISTQVVNEFCNVSLKKLNFSFDEIIFSIDKFMEIFDIQVVSISTIKHAVKIKEKYAFSYYDSVIVASALQDNCKILYTEDMQHKQIIENTLTIINPFKQLSKKIIKLIWLLSLAEVNISKSQLAEILSFAHMETLNKISYKKLAVPTKFIVNWAPAYWNLPTKFAWNMNYSKMV